MSEKCVQQSGTDRGADELAQTLNDYMSDVLDGKSHAARLLYIRP